MKIVLAVTAVGWVAFWFWAFSFAYSSSFFLYNPHSRIPTFATTLLAICGVPASALIQWRSVRVGRRRPLGALAVHAAASCCLLAVPLATAFALSRASTPWRLEADGVGIDNAALLLVAVASLVVLGVALRVRPPRGRI